MKVERQGSVRERFLGALFQLAVTIGGFLLDWNPQLLNFQSFSFPYWSADKLTLETGKENGMRLQILRCSEEEFKFSLSLFSEHVLYFENIFDIFVEKKGENATLLAVIC